jgi:hypothetical protein
VGKASEEARWRRGGRPGKTNRGGPESGGLSRPPRRGRPWNADRWHPPQGQRCRSSCVVPIPRDRSGKSVVNFHEMHIDRPNSVTFCVKPHSHSYRLPSVSAITLTASTSHLLIRRDRPSKHGVRASAYTPFPRRLETVPCASLEPLVEPVYAAAPAGRSRSASCSRPRPGPRGPRIEVPYGCR